MKLGLLSDVHANRIALEAVLADGRSQGVGTWWTLGDPVAIGPVPVPTLDLLTSVPNLRATRGNTDRYVVSRDRPPPYPGEVAAKPELLGLFAAVEGSFAWTRGALASHGWPDWLAGLPLESRATLPDGTRVLGVHASPGRDDGEGITPDRPEPELRAALAGAAADVVCAGHTHRPADWVIGSVHAVNLGSVSNPITDDLRASYVIIHADRQGHRVEHRRVGYDHAAVLDRVARSGHPGAEYLASFQRGEHIKFPARRPGAPAVLPPLEERKAVEKGRGQLLRVGPPRLPRVGEEAAGAAAQPWLGGIRSLGPAPYPIEKRAAGEAVPCPCPCSPLPWTGRCRPGLPAVSGLRTWSGPVLRRPSRRSW